MTRLALVDLALVIAGVWIAAAVGTWIAERLERRALRRRALARLRLIQNNERGAPREGHAPL